MEFSVNLEVSQSFMYVVAYGIVWLVVLFYSFVFVNDKASNALNKLGMWYSDSRYYGAFFAWLYLAAYIYVTAKYIL